MLKSIYLFAHCCRREIRRWGTVFNLYVINLKIWNARLIEEAFLLYQINKIRDSFAVMGDNSTAYSLPQVCCNGIILCVSCSAVTISSIDSCNVVCMKFMSTCQSVSHHLGAGRTCLTLLFQATYCFCASIVVIRILSKQLSLKHSKSFLEMNWPPYPHQCCQSELMAALKNGCNVLIVGTRVICHSSLFGLKFATAILK